MRVLVLCGPTASGKTQIAAFLDPDRYEIISCDSRQIYRGLPIGTAQPPRDLMNRLSHHLVDFLPPDQEYSAARFVVDAHRTMAEIVTRGKEPVIVGGAGFYLRALMYGMFPSVAPSVQAMVARMEPEERLLELRRLDPASLREGGGHIHENDAYRIERALALSISSQKPFSLHWKDARARMERKDTGTIQYGGFSIVCDLKSLHGRIRERAREMIAAGFLSETGAVLEQYGECAALKTIGYPEACAVLRGEGKAEYLIEELTAAHYQYARRQLIWFRREAFRFESRETLMKAFAGGAFPHNF